ncbi:hypothetical protein [uncultured Draconibacterium sp.]|uniref:hypothetical protein n=1 Tax=uncultured Draconibacterium sp. TaxID=1573823 RepID=UPI0029C87EB8|nr:hypothetical protein [uncultured Draconibacterium sp.]
MKTIKSAIICQILLMFSFCACKTQEIKHCNTNLDFYPKTYSAHPELDSPCLLDNGKEILVINTKNNQYAIVPVTVENGEPRNYIADKWGKGNQLATGCSDFPVLSKKGLHSEKELLNTKSITGKPVEAISEEARPGRSSFEGFIAEDEDIISVLITDNQLVQQLGFTHPDLASPLFHIYNLILEHRSHFVGRARIFDDVSTLYYNGQKLHLKWGADKGFQTSIFNDGNLGYYWIKIQRDLKEEEISYLRKQYSYLNENDFQMLVEKLSGFNTGEMVPYYIMNYGFYEGHTGYRADPIAIAFLFGLKSLPEIDEAFNHELPQFLRI